MKTFLLLLGSHLAVFSGGFVICYLNQAWVEKKLVAIKNVFSK